MLSGKPFINQKPRAYFLQWFQICTIQQGNHTTIAYVSYHMEYNHSWMSLCTVQLSLNAGVVVSGNFLFNLPVFVTVAITWPSPFVLPSRSFVPSEFICFNLSPFEASRALSLHWWKRKASLSNGHGRQHKLNNVLCTRQFKGDDRQVCAWAQLHSTGMLVKV